MSARTHMAKLHELPCVICGAKPVSAHHLESVRDENSDYAAIPVCYEHHQGANGIHGLSRRAFEMRYKLTPIDLLSLTIKLLEKA